MVSVVVGRLDACMRRRDEQRKPNRNKFQRLVLGCPGLVGLDGMNQGLVSSFSSSSSSLLPTRKTNDEDRMPFMESSGRFPMWGTSVDRLEVIDRHWESH